MKIKISKIDQTTYAIREKVDPEYLKELKESLKEDGQWDPIIVRPKDGKYELIAGHNRVMAAGELGWDEIEATVKDLSDIESLFLSLKTNLLRQDMSEREQGKVLHNLTQSFKITQTELARRLGKNEKWVRTRIKLALDLHPNVAKALEENKISMRVAEIIATLGEPNNNRPQDDFLKYLFDNKIKLSDEEEVRTAKKRFINNTIYTIGYEGKSIEQFIKLLKDNGIEQLIDVRLSAESQFKADFNKEILQRELTREKIKYIHRADYGVPYEWQNPYKDGAISVECFEKYYRWHIKKELGADFPVFVKNIKESGKTALMCMEKSAKPMKDQKITCHRSILANLMMESLEFQERVDL
jgi:ParB family chromosome partitioning protein